MGGMIDLTKYISPYKTVRRIKLLLEEGRCPSCEFKFEGNDHIDCEYWKDIHKRNHRQTTINRS